MSDLIERTLRHRVDDVETELREVAPRRVVERARQARRRRRAVASGVIGVVVAVAATGALTATTRGERPVGPATHPEHRQWSWTTTTSLSDVGRGKAPAFGYGYGDRLHLADGRTVPAPTSTYGTWAPYAGGYLVEQAGGSADLLRYDAAGTKVGRYAHGTVAVAQDGVTTAWTDNQTLHMGPAGGFLGAQMPVTNALGVVGFLPADHVVVNSYRPLVVDRTGTHDLRGPLLDVTCTSSRTGLVAGLLRDKTTYGVVDSSTGHLLWRTDQQLLRFSLDGRYVLAEAGRSPAHSLSVLDAQTGNQVAGWVAADARSLDVEAAAWETEETALFVVVDEKTRRQAVLRLSLHDGVDRATAIVSTDRAIVFQQTP